MAMPFLLQLGSSHSPAQWLSKATSIAALVPTSFTDHKLGLLRMLPDSVHLVEGFFVEGVFVIAQGALGFSGLDAIFYRVNGTAVLAVMSLHKRELPQPVMA